MTNEEIQDKIIDEFNHNYRNGTPVILIDDFGIEHKTRTRSPAWYCGGRALVMVEGRAGGYDLSRINPIQNCEV